MSALAAASSVTPNETPSLLRRFGRRKFDAQPTDGATVLIASAGNDVPKKAIRRAVEVSEGGAVAVVNLARIYGSSLGLPNPGLMPTRKELDEERARVRAAIGALERSGVVASGQVAATRRPVKTIVRVAVAHQVRVVLVVTPETSRWRQVVEGDLARDVSRRLGDGVLVESISVKPQP